MHQWKQTLEILNSSGTFWKNKCSAVNHAKDKTLVFTNHFNVKEVFTFYSKILLDRSLIKQSHKVQTCGGFSLSSKAVCHIYCILNLH